MRNASFEHNGDKVSDGDSHKKTTSKYMGSMPYFRGVSIPSI